MNVYADTNFFTYLYLSDEGSSSALHVFADERPALPITWLLRVELVNAFQQAVFSGFGETRTRITPEHAAACQQHFRDDLKAGIALCATELSFNEVTRLFEEIALRHTARHGFRTYDILHVAPALALKCRKFWSFDKRASKLAKLEGLRTL